MKEKDFQKQLIKDLSKQFPNSIILKNDPNYLQGVPDLLILYKKHWAMLECKKSKDSPKRPNQEYYVNQLNDMSFARFIYPENKLEVINEMKMVWYDHKKDIPKDAHAFLSASKYAWLNYDDQKLVQAYLNHLATVRGTKLHDLASKCIEMGERLEVNDKALNRFVNDSIELGLRTEQALKYSELCFGRADAIGLDEKLNILHVFDFKSGKSRVSMAQLEIYAALFCLEYEFDPYDIVGFDLRIYQNGKNHCPVVSQPTSEYISSIMYKIINADKLLGEIDINLYEGDLSV